MDLLSILHKNQNFKNYFVADVISTFGTGMSLIGANWYILERTGKSRSVGFLMVIIIISGFLISPLAGVISDRYRRVSIIFWSNLIRGIVILLNVILFYSGHFNEYNLYFLAAIAGIGWNIFMPASRGFLQEVVPREDLGKANSLLETSLQVGLFISAGMSGIIYKYAGFGMIILIDAVTFFVSNIYVLRIHYESITASVQPASYFHQLKDGYRYLVNRPTIFLLGIIMMLPSVATFSFNVIAPGYISKYLRESSVVFGIADMSFGVGACIAGLLVARMLLHLKQNTSIYLFLFISFCSYLMMVFNSSKYGLFLLSAILGLCSSLAKIVMNTVLMGVVAKNYFGRSMSVWFSFTLLLQIVSVYGLGVLIDVIPVNQGFYLLSSIFLIAFAGFFLLPKKWEAENREI